jgi:GTP cyclohydrolase I
MSAPTSPQRKLPDVATESRPDLAGALDGVGMERIEMPVLLLGADGVAQRMSARVDAFVNLAREDGRGIHMSRLYLHLDRHLSAEPLTPASLRRCLRDFLESHADLSDRAWLRVRFDHLVRRLARNSSSWTVKIDIGTKKVEFEWQPMLSMRAPAHGMPLDKCDPAIPDHACPKCYTT